jgi:hypothetical protein
LCAQAFTDHYYATFDSNRQALVGLYQEQSFLTFEGQKFAGPSQVRPSPARPSSTLLAPERCAG